ncbi:MULTISPECIES: discoidin domain-containing protein [unclassified Lysinibacillus]|uniref:discoidin domain-containing protein n=1 Tax=unclassified Lysinibacillus TaxID=2636778 RepID=UPI0038275250
MPRVNLPTSYVGEEITSEKLKVQAFSGNIWNPSGVLFNDIVTMEGQYGACLLRYNNYYLEFTIPDNYASADVWFTSGYYSDSGGRSGQPTTLRKLIKNSQELEVISSSVPTTTTSTWYKYYGNLESGTYRIYPNSAYIQFNEMFVSGVKKGFYMLQSNNKTYSIESFDTTHETKMTSNTSPSPFIASASSEFNSTYSAYKAFNSTNTGGSYDYWSSVAGTTGWIQINYGRKVHANTLELSSSMITQEIANGMPRDFNILASNDNSKFIKLAEFKDQTWKNGETKIYKFRNNIAYQYYRIETFSTNGFGYVCIGEISFKNIANNITEVPKVSVNNFINYGTNNFKNLNRIIETKKYILQDEVSNNEEGFLTTKLDRKPLSISCK